MVRLAQTSTLFPYTTLFRSVAERERDAGFGRRRVVEEQPLTERVGAHVRPQRGEPGLVLAGAPAAARVGTDRKSTRLNSSHPSISYAVFCLKKKTILTSLLF